MAKQTNQKPVRRDDGWLGYVNYSPGEGDRPKIVFILDNPKWNPADQLEEFTQSGYSATFSHDDASSCERLSLTGKGDGNPNKGYTLSIRASSVLRCLAIATYYCDVLCQGQDWLIDKASKEVW